MTKEELHAKIVEEEAILQEWRDEQLVRIPDMATWNALTIEEQDKEKEDEASLVLNVRLAKKMYKDQCEKERIFFEARSTAFNDLNAQHEADKVDLALVWQNKENEGFVV